MTNINFDSMTIAELGEMAKYYSTSYPVDSIERMVRSNSRSTLTAAIKFSSKFMQESRTGKFTFNANTKVSTSVEMDDNVRVQQAYEERMRNAEKFVDNICRRWAAAYGLEAEYDRRTK